MALYVLFENKNTLLCIYFICPLFNLQMCQIILADPVYEVFYCNSTCCRYACTQGRTHIFLKGGGVIFQKATSTQL